MPKFEDILRRKVTQTVLRPVSVLFGDVLIAEVFKAKVSAPLVGVDRGAREYVLSDDAMDRLA